MAEQYHLDQRAADRAVRFIERMGTHVKGELAGKPLILEDWQKNDIIIPAFGWRDRITGLRQYRIVYVEIPRKNAKSTLAAAVGLLLLMGDNEPGAEIYSAAADKGQAKIIFDVARTMVSQKKALSSRVTSMQKSIVYKSSFYQAVSSESSTKHGYNAHGILIDELHAHKSDDLYNVLTTSVGSRRQPMTVILTTAGTDKTTIGWRMHEYARKVKEGILEDPAFLPVIYGADPDDDVLSLETWKKANPGLGSIVKLSYIQDQAKRIQNEPSFETTFKQLHLNIWADSAESWLSDSEFMSCAKGPRSWDELRGRSCKAAGLDLASTADINAMAMLFPWEDGDGYDLKVIFWVPQERAKARSLAADVNYQNWINQGHMEVTPGNVTDYNHLKKRIIELDAEHEIEVLGFDPWNSSQMMIDLDEGGLRSLDKVSQGVATLSPATKLLERLIKSGKIHHDGNPVLRWMFSNVVLYRDSNENIKPDKKKSKDKIDGVMAIATALTSATSPDANKVDLNKIYEKKGLSSV